MLYISYSNGAGPYDGSSGDVWKFDTSASTWTRISPVPSTDTANDYFGYGGLTVDAQNPNIIMVAALNSWWPDTILFRSLDGCQKSGRRSSSSTPTQSRCRFIGSSSNRSPTTLITACLDALLAQAREHHVHLILLWFGTWKNGSSHYIPMRIKRQPERYPRMMMKDGKPIDSPSPFAPATLQADIHAFSALMKHLKTANRSAP